MAVSKMPVLYLSHGAPPLADHATWPDELAAWSRDLPQPKAIPMISAHWEEAPLRDEGVLIIGSGFFTHNLRAITGDDSVISPVMAEFDDWGRQTLEAGDVDAMLDFERKAPVGRLAHPRTEHFAPLFVTLGAAEDEVNTQRAVIDGFWLGMARRSIQLG